MLKFSVYLVIYLITVVLITSTVVLFTQHNGGLYVFEFLFILSNDTEKLEPKRHAKPGPKLVIDHDGGADDAMAIFLSLLFEKYYGGPSIIGLTTVNGNVDETQVFENSQRLLDIAGRRDIPIYRGNARSLVTTVDSDFYFGFDGLGDNEDVVCEQMKSQDTHAAVALIEMSKTFPGELIIMSIGPLTNIALAIRLDPEFISRLAQLYIGAGNIYNEHNDTPEFNAKLDVEAYHVVADSAYRNKVTVIPYSQIKQSLKISKEWRVDVFGAIPTKIMKALNSFERISLDKSNSWKPLDLAVAATVLNQRVVNEMKYSKNGIILCGLKRGINTNDFRTEEANVKLMYSANIESYKDFLLDVFSKDIQC